VKEKECVYVCVPVKRAKGEERERREKEDHYRRTQTHKQER
jgi:hypothetical protein